MSAASSQRPRLVTAVVLAVAGTTLVGCQLATNFLEPDGPRFACDDSLHDGFASYVRAPPAAKATVKVVSYNLKLAEYPNEASGVLKDEPTLAGADILLMQEMRADASDTLARKLGMCFIYYPSSVHDNGLFGNAILSPWPRLSDRKVLMPHADPYNHRRRHAVFAVLDIGGAAITAVSLHGAPPTVGLDARLDQSRTVLDSIGDVAQIPHAIVGGDFNTVEPDSAHQTAALFAGRGFEHASADSGPTQDAVWNKTLDHVFSRGLPGLETGVYWGEAHSDHQPLWVSLEAPK